MASRNLARLGVVLGIDTAAWEADINQAISASKKLSRDIKSDSNAAEKEILRLKFATEDYGKTLTQVDLIQREISNGRYLNATQQHKDALLKQAAAYDALANSSKKAGFAMSDQQKIQLSYQTTDLVTQIASGGNPLIAMMQQGGQLKDAMGGMGNMLRAIGTLFTPLTVGVGLFTAALGTMAYAAFKGAKEVDELNKTLALTGNIAGMTQGSFHNLAKGLSDDSTITIGNAKEVLMSLADTGLYGGDAMKAASQAILQFSRISGLSGKEAADKLMSSLDGTASSSKRLNEQYHFLTLAQYRQIEALERHGKQQEAITLQSELLAKKFKDQGDQINVLSGLWADLKDKVSSAWDSMMGMGKAETVEQRIARLQQLLKNQNSGEYDAMGNYLGPGVSYQEQLDAALAEKAAADKKALQQSAEAAKNAKEIADYAFAGGDAKATALRQERQKLELQNFYEQEKLNANDIQKVQLDAEEKTYQAMLEMQKKNLAERGVFRKENEQVFAAQAIAIEREEARQIKEIRLKAYLEESAAAQQQYDEAHEIVAKRINDQQILLASLREIGRVNEINNQAEQDKLNMKLKMMGATQKEVDLAMIQIELAKELALLERENLSPEAYDQKKRNIEEIYRNKQAMAELTEQMRKAGQIHEAIFGNMEKALEDFVRNGKLSFQDFAKSVIQDLLLIEMKMQATYLLRKGLQGASSFLNDITGNFFGNLFGARAEGGPVQGGASYLVGENGPEIFTSPSSGTIIPNHALAMAGGGGPTINYNGPFIQNMSAIDTQSGIAFLAKNKQAVWAANQSAQRSLPVSR